MPELPDLTLYLTHLEQRVQGQPLLNVRLASMFLLRTVEPPLDALTGQPVKRLQRIGKQLVFTFDAKDDTEGTVELHMVIHLMISGRLRWKEPGAGIAGRNVVAGFDFPQGTLIFTEASKKKRASLRVVDDAGLAALDLGGLEIFEVSVEEYVERLRDSGHTLKRALTDQRVFAGIGNAYSDEILLRAQMSPFKRAGALSDEEGKVLFDSTRAVMTEWTDRLMASTGDNFPDKVTAFHKQMAVHGKYKEPCPVCGSPVQRIRYAENEANYCAGCQTGGKLLADRSLSRLLKNNWPKRLEDLET